jgi:hypothetical protein
MEDDLKESPLERLRKRLYSPKPLEGAGAPQNFGNGPAAPERWAPEPVVEREVKVRKRLSVATIFLLFAAGFFLIAGITTSVVLFLGGRSLSSDHLTVLVEDGPVQVPGGKATSFSISITNNNPLAVTGGTLTLLFPDGTVEPDDASIALPHFTETFGAIEPGETKTFTARAAFFGSENQKLSIPITVEYQTEESNATFNKKTTYDFTISTSPVMVNVSTLSELSSGQSLTLLVSVRSNVAEALSDVAIQADYPFGFALAKTEPEAVDGKLFELGTLRPGEEKQLRITGTLSGQEGDERVFRFTAGALKAGSKGFRVPYMVADAEVKIARPFLSVTTDLNRSSSETIVVRSSELVSGLLSWSNALSVPISDATISVAFSGNALDPESVQATNGFYRSQDRTIVYDKNTMGALATLNPGDTGNGAFNFKSKVGSALSSLRNPTITLNVSVSGRQPGAGRIGEAITSTQTRTVKVASDLTLDSELLRTTGGIANTGPWPPEAEKATTYTVHLVAKNTVNSVGGAKARMILPSYVSYTGKTSGGASIAFTEGTREVVWSIGDIGPGATKEAYFQVSFLPSATQKGTSPTVVLEQTLAGTDRFVQQEVSDKAPQLTTQTTTDPAYQSDFGTVLK